MLITQQGKILRMIGKDIRPIGRATQGVRLIEIDGEDRVVSMARLADQDLTEKSGDVAPTSDADEGSAED